MSKQYLICQECYNNERQPKVLRKDDFVKCDLNSLFAFAATEQADTPEPWTEEQLVRLA